FPSSGGPFSFSGSSAKHDTATKATRTQRPAPIKNDLVAYRPYETVAIFSPPRCSPQTCPRCIPASHSNVNLSPAQPSQAKSGARRSFGKVIEQRGDLERVVIGQYANGRIAGPIVAGPEANPAVFSPDFDHSLLNGPYIGLAIWLGLAHGSVIR